MKESAATSDRRAQHVAALGLLLQLASFGAMLGISIWSNSHAIGAVARLLLVGVPIWLILFLVFKQMCRVRAEALETAELRRSREAGSSDALFELDDEALLLEQNRLQWMVRWMLPAVTVLLAVVLLGGQFVGWAWSLENAFKSSAEGGLHRTDNPTLMMWFVVFVGFLCFLYARYSIALSRMSDWRLLRAGATCMAGNALACLALAIALMAGSTLEWGEPLVAYAIRVLLVILGLEFSANFILDLYRPRTAGVIPRPSFESRLLGLISEPGGIAKSIAEAVNYQFGFEVSSTWFYQLLQRWLFPIMVFTLAVVLALTSVVLVNANEQVVVERFGRLVEKPSDVLAPGLHFKWPFPIDIVYRAPVKRISELVIGEATAVEDDDLRKAVVWTEAHDYVPELMLLVASAKSKEDERLSAGDAHAINPAQSTQSVAVNLLMVSVPIEYRIRDIRKYLYTYDDPVKLMEGIAYQFLSDYAASVDIDQLMGPGREAINRELRTMIQSRLDELEVGIEIVFAGIRGAHPPADDNVASSFQAVVGAQTIKAATIHAAQGEARKKLIGVAGTEARALALDEAIRELNRLRAGSGASSAEVAAAKQAIEDLLVGNSAKDIAPLSGEAAARIADSRAAASNLVSDAQSKVRAFATEVAAFSAAPALYQQRRILEVFSGLEHVRKYLVLGDASNVIVEYQTTEQGGLDRVLSEGLKKSEK